MAKVLVTEGYLRNIAEAIRSKNGASTAYRPGDMAAAIQAIPTGGITPTGTVNITQNGNHDVTQYASANVNVQPNLQSKTATQNGTVIPDQGYDGLSSVVVDVSGGGGGVILWESIIGVTGTGISYDKTITIETAGIYSIKACGAITDLNLKINDVAQTKDFYNGSWYANFYDKTVSLSAGDTIEISGADTGRSYLFAGIILQN